MNRKKTLVGAILGLIALFGMFWFYSWFLTATIMVTSPQADIYIKQGNVEVSAKGRATFRTRSTEKVFIEAKKDGSAAQKYVQPERRQTINVSLDLKQPVEAERVGTGPLSHSLIEDGFIYGINPYNGYLGVEPLAGNDTNQLPKIPFLPSLAQVVWRDSRNFIYITSTEGAGVVSTQPGASVEGLIYTAAASSDDITALLDSKGLYLANGIDAKNAKKIDSAQTNVPPFLFADDRFVFYGWSVFEDVHGNQDEEPAVSVEDEEAEEDDPGIESSRLKIFNHSGERLYEITIPSKDQVYKILSVNESELVALAGDGLFIINLDSDEPKTEGKTFSFGRVRDMVMADSRLLLLGPAGLWEYSLDNDEYYKMASYPVGGEYVPTTLTAQGSTLYFSTSIEEDGFSKNQDIQNNIFKITLDN